MAESESTKVIGHDSLMDQKCRVYASMSFAVLLLFVGLPLWWYTTAVPRVSLPYHGISELDKLETRLRLRLYLGCLELDKSQLLGAELLQRLTDAGQSQVYKISLSHFATGNTSIAKMKTISDLEKAARNFTDLEYGDLLVLEAPVGFEDGQLVHVGTGRAVFFSKEADGTILAKVLREWIYRDASLMLTKNALSLPTEYSLDTENRRRFPVSPNYDVLLTMVNPEPENIKLNTSFTRIAQDYLEPFLENLSPVADFSVKTQWLYLLPLGVKPKMILDSTKLGRHFALPEDVLPQIITPLETKLASQVSLHPTINLVAYVVPCGNAPTYIYARNGRRLSKMHVFEAFHSPRWGGIILVNPPAEFCENAKDDVLEPNTEVIIKVFLTQLRLLIGIPDKDEIEGVSLSSMDGQRARDWELDDLMRMRSVEQLTSAKLTLQSLAQLLKEISNIVINDTVGNRITTALALIRDAARRLEQADLLRGFLASKHAFVLAEAAFTDPSLLALLYFPDDQKYAVYIPLFLPVMIPVLFSLKKIIVYLSSSR